ncbi:hypothetical protein ONZ45_g18963 [Pleurotus djamor]|nr:hypothetical protein ONZ45_g18963 [Pleurotus djamor]
MSLPAPSPSQAYCTVSALEAGFIELPDHMYITTAIPGSITKVPSLAFLITHSESKKRILFDLGIRKDFATGYTPATIKRIHDIFVTDVPKDVVQSLEEGGVKPSDVDTIILSHLHWDHIGDPSLFKNATFIVGGEGEGLLRKGYPVDENALFAQDLLPRGRTQFLKTDDSDWELFWPFTHAMDYFGDGSLYIVDAPGHLPGHLNLLFRSSAHGGWIYLAGDSAHNVQLLTGKAEVAIYGANKCAHASKMLAEEHLSRVRVLSKMAKVEVILAHDAAWFAEHQGAILPGAISSP